MTRPVSDNRVVEVVEALGAECGAPAALEIAAVGVFILIIVIRILAPTLTRSSRQERRIIGLRRLLPPLYHLLRMRTLAAVVGIKFDGLGLVDEQGNEE